MKLLRVFAAFIFLLSAGSRAEADLQISTTLDVFDDGGLASKRYIEYANELGYVIDGVGVSYYHTIVNTSSAQSGIEATPISGSLRDGRAAAGSCYSARLTAETVNVTPYSQKAASAGPTCWYGPPKPPDPPVTIYDDSGCPQYQNCNSPIVINLGGGAYHLSGPDQPVDFDIDADGSTNRITWTAAGAQMAFLALDRNGNGRIDDGAELFGNHTPSGAANGFDALALHDANGDGLIDARDAIWPSLLLWADSNHDGVSQPSELVPLSESAVTAIGSSYHWSGRHDGSGNVFRYEGRVWIDDRPRPVYDVYFASVR